MSTFDSSRRSPSSAIWQAKDPDHHDISNAFQMERLGVGGR
ncbi:hypothetical protein AVEN_271583-1, partial [Araneus ventricosus]